MEVLKMVLLGAAIAAVLLRRDNLAIAAGVWAMAL